MEDFGLKNETNQVRKDMELMKKELDEVKKENMFLKREGEEIKEIVRQIKNDAANKKEIDDMNMAVVEVRKENEGLRQLWSGVVENKSKVEESKETTSAGAVSNIREERKLKAEVAEVIDRENRKKNLIIMGLEEGTNEEESESEKVAEIFRELLEGVPVRLGTVERLGKKGDKVRHIRVTIEDQYTRRKILAKAKNLKEKSATKKLFIVPDLTRLQQENDKKLRDKLRTLKAEGIQNVKIQKGEIIKIDGNEREVLFRIEQ